jgi:hypothetical protein
MRGSEPYQRCSCRDPVTRKQLRKRCPKLKDKGHALGWFFRYDAPRGPDGRRRPETGPFAMKKEADREQAAILARKRNVDEVIRAMLLINRPLPGELAPSEAEMLRRMLAARADDERRQLAPGERRHKKSPRPLSPARIARMFAPFRAAMNAAVPDPLAVSPCAKVELPAARKPRALAWTPDREEAFRAALARQIRMAGPALDHRRATGDVGRPRSAAVPGDGVAAVPYRGVPRLHRR